jgi:hypothetical protein
MPYTGTGERRLTAAVLLAAALALLLAAALAAAVGCGGGGQPTMKDNLVDYVVRNVVAPAKQLPVQLVVLQRYPIEDLSAGPEAVNEKMWKIEDGMVTEISLEEFTTLADETSSGSGSPWTASQHSVRVQALDEAAGTARVEVDSMYGPMSVDGIIYKLEYSNGAWKVVSRTSIWGS